MGDLPAAGYGRVVAWSGGGAFVGSLLYCIGCYTWRFGDPDAGSGRIVVPVCVDLALFVAFAGHHSLFARPRWRARIRGVGPADLERPLYVWVASLLFVAVCAAWEPVAGVAWRAAGLGRVLLGAGQVAGAALTVLAARRLDVLALAGIRPTPRPEPASLDTHGPYGFVRHPIYVGWLLLVWCVPVMTGTRLAFAVISTAYLVVAVPLEERDLARTFPEYGAYRRRVRWRMLPGVY